MSRFKLMQSDKPMSNRMDLAGSSDTKLLQRSRLCVLVPEHLASGGPAE
jgi:hypothetical protein